MSTYAASFLSRWNNSITNFNIIFDNT
jgi:hypothetical protein